VRGASETEGAGWQAEDLRYYHSPSILLLPSGPWVALSPQRQSIASDHRNLQVAQAEIATAVETIRTLGDSYDCS
jgi:hypothetical protein